MNFPPTRQLAALAPIDLNVWSLPYMKCKQTIIFYYTIKQKQYKVPEEKYDENKKKEWKKTELNLTIVYTEKPNEMECLHLLTIPLLSKLLFYPRKLQVEQQYSDAWAWKREESLKTGRLTIPSRGRHRCDSRKLPTVLLHFCGPTWNKKMKKILK